MLTQYQTKHPLVRRARRDDIPELERLILAALAAFRGQVAASNLLEAYVENSCSIADRWDDGEVLVVEESGRLAGTVTWYPDASREGLGLPQEWAGFRTLAVHPALQGRGLGRLLVEECIGRARAKGVRTIGIHTAAFMKAAWRVYAKAGFCPCPDYDLWASAVLNREPILGDVRVIACRLDVEPVV